MENLRDIPSSGMLCNLKSQKTEDLIYIEAED